MSYRRRKAPARIGAGVLLAAACTLAPAAAMAAPTDEVSPMQGQVCEVPTLSASASSVEAGQSITFTGVCFPNDSSARVTVVETGNSVSAPTDGDGAFSASLTIDEPGTYTVQASVGGVQHDTTVTVTEAAPTDPEPEDPEPTDPEPEPEPEPEPDPDEPTVPEPAPDEPTDPGEPTDPDEPAPGEGEGGEGEGGAGDGEDPGADTGDDTGGADDAAGEDNSDEDNAEDGTDDTDADTGGNGGNDGGENPDEDGTGSSDTGGDDVDAGSGGPSTGNGEGGGDDAQSPGTGTESGTNDTAPPSASGQSPTSPGDPASPNAPSNDAPAPGTELTGAQQRSLAQALDLGEALSGMYGDSDDASGGEEELAATGVELSASAALAIVALGAGSGLVWQQRRHDG